MPRFFRDVSPVGLERCLHTAEVIGSNPIRPTKFRSRGLSSAFFVIFAPDFNFLKSMQKKEKHFLEKPKYPGGQKALRQFISAHLQYPQDAMEQRVEGVVTVSYQVSDEGEILDPVVVKSLCPSCDEEAVRLVQLLRYEQVRNRGIRLRMNCKLNIHFHLSPTPAASTITYSLQPSTTKKKKKNSNTSNKT